MSETKKLGHFKVVEGRVLVDGEMTLEEMRKKEKKEKDK